MIDAHCHLYSNRFDPDRDQVIARARESLQAVVVSAVDSGSLRKSLAIRGQHPDFIHVTAGIYPGKSVNFEKSVLAHLWQQIENVREEIVAVGEVGPDFHHVKSSRLRRRQLLMLEEALRRAEAWNLPLVVHARRAEEAALEVVRGSRVRVVFHCFAGDRQMARRIASCGFYLSFSPLLLGNPELQRVPTEVPLELILTETDSPALSRQPGRSRNEPAFVQGVVFCLAGLLQYQPKAVAAATAANARRFYGLTRHAGI